MVMKKECGISLPAAILRALMAPFPYLPPPPLRNLLFFILTAFGHGQALQASAFPFLFPFPVVGDILFSAEAFFPVFGALLDKA